MTPKALETERLVLREMEMSDLGDLMGIFSDPVAMRYYPNTKSREGDGRRARCLSQTRGFPLARE